MAALRGPGTAAPKRRSGTAGDIDEASGAVNKGFGGHGARCTARAASFVEEEPPWGFTRVQHSAQPADQGRYGQPSDLGGIMSLG
jgi:hypothetical protein